MAKKAEIIKRPLEKVTGDIKRSARWSIFESLAILIMGFLFVVWPDTMMRIFAYIVGTFFLVKGAFQIVSYFLEQGQKDFFNNNLLSGVICVLIGIVAFVIGVDIVNVFRIVVGIFLIYESLVRMNIAIKFHAAKIDAWRYVLVLALIILALGVFVVVNDVSTIIGWMMVLAGIVGIISDTFFIQHVNNLTDALSGKVVDSDNSEKKPEA